MKIGFISYWFNRGQAVITRNLRDSFKQLGWDTFVLARPAPDRFGMVSYVDGGDKWKQDNVTVASNTLPTVSEVLKWAKDESLDVVHTDQFYGFDCLQALRASGIKVIGRFVWESFAKTHVQDSLKAFDAIYSFTRCEQERYKSLGIDSPYIPFGCFEELVTERKPIDKFEKFTFFYSGGLLSRRRPNGAVIEAFKQIDNPDIRMIVKVQRPFQRTDFIRPEEQIDLKKRDKFYPWADEAVTDLRNVDSRIQVVSDDVSHDEYFNLLRKCHVCAIPSRWEGLGVHLYEANAFAIPTLSNDIPPINEVIQHGRNGHLTASHILGRNKTGILTYEPDVGSLVDGFKLMTDREYVNDLSLGASEVAREMSWGKTIGALEELARY